MKNRFFILLVFICAVKCAAAIPYNEFWQRGNSQFEARAYDSAAYYFEQLAAVNAKVPEVYYNLGNAYYRLNNIGAAVLNYSKALKLDPGYKQAEDNLELAQSRIKNRVQAAEDVFFISWWKSITHPARSEMWAIVGLTLFIVLLGLIYFRKVRRQNVAPQLVALASVFCVLTITFAYFSSKKVTASSNAVVMEDNASFRVEQNMKGGQSLIPAGTIVRFEDSIDAGWVRVALPDGREGAMQRSSLQKI